MIFHNFEKPVAAASLAQVHKATLKSNKKEVAVKVLRPGIEKAFLRDIDAFYFIARFIELLSPSSRRLKPLEVIKYFEGVASSFELREAQLQLYSAQNKYVKSIQDVIQKKLFLETLINTPQ